MFDSTPTSQIHSNTISTKHKQWILFEWSVQPCSKGYSNFISNISQDECWVLHGHLFQSEFGQNTHYAKQILKQTKKWQWKAVILKVAQWKVGTSEKTAENIKLCNYGLSLGSWLWAFVLHSFLFLHLAIHAQLSVTHLHAIGFTRNKMKKSTAVLVFDTVKLKFFNLENKKSMQHLKNTSLQMNFVCQNTQQMKIANAEQHVSSQICKNLHL